MAKKKNLDNLNTETDDMENKVLSDYNDAAEEVEPYDMDNDESALDDDDDDFHFEFESDDDEEESTDDSPADDNEEEADEPEDEKPSSKKAPKATSKQEKAIVALKREQKKLRDDNIKLQKMLEDRKQESEADNLVQKYVSDGHDESTAKRMAQQDMNYKVQQDRLELLEFKDLNADTLLRYPGATKEADRIKKIVDTTGISVEQACRGLYGTRPDYEERARSKVTVEDDYDDDGISRASRGSQQPKKSVLTAQQRKMKATIERRFLDGDKMTDKEFLDKYNRSQKG